MTKARIDNGRWLAWIVIGVPSIVAGALLGALGEIGIFASLGLLWIVIGLLILNSPILLLYIVLVISASVSVFREVAIPLGNTQMTLSGFLWLFIAGIVWLYLLVHARDVRVPRYLWPFIAFLLWAVIRWVITPTGFRGLKDILWYSMPVLFGLFVLIALGRDKATIAANVKRIEKAFMYSALIPLVLYAIALLTGLAEMTWRGPRGDLIGAARGTPLYLLIVLAVALTNWRYGPLKGLGKLSSLVSLGTIFFTLARMASLLGLALVSLHRVNPRRKWQILGSMLLASLIAFYAITHIPVLQQRFFFGEDWDVSMGITGFNTAGRNLIWPVIYASAVQEPVIGHGLGTARLITAQLFVGKKDVTEYHPHNEYLQVFHDLGVVGLALTLLSWLGVLLSKWRLWERATNPLTLKWGMTAALSTGIVLVSSVTDNTLHYPIVVVPAVIISSISYLFD